MSKPKTNKEIYQKVLNRTNIKMCDVLEEFKNAALQRYQMAFYSDVMRDFEEAYCEYVYTVYAKLEPWGA